MVGVVAARPDTLCVVDFLDFARRYPRAAHAVVRGIVKFREALPREINDPHGWPRLARCGDVRGDPRKVRAVAREVYSDLIGVEDSSRRISGDGWQPRMTVRQRFPRGEKDLEPLVTEVCNEAAPDARPFSILWQRFVRELRLDAR
jgi:hypothetical protein